jgi:hypothetical protein
MINQELYDKIERSISKFDDISGKSGLSVEYIIINLLIQHNKLDKVNYADMLEAVMLTDGSNIEEFLEKMYKKVEL